MERVFGLPAGPLALALAALLAVTAGAITVLAVRNMVFLRIGLRNIPRRRSRSVLIVLGLMLGTAIIASALLTGDTMASSVRAGVSTSLALTDETVTAGTDADVVDVDLDATKPYFDAAEAVATIEAATADLPVDGVMAAIVEPVAAQNVAAGRTEPRLTLFAPDAARAGSFGLGAVAAVRPGEVLINRDAARELRADLGTELTLLTGEGTLNLRVAAIGDYRGTTTDGPAAMIALAEAQRALGRTDQVNTVVVSNDGGATSGVRHTDAVEAAIDRAVAPLGLDAQPSKRDALDQAEATGNAFVQLFTTFGTFSMAAGVLLIFLIFVMLAAERRPEMGMARAVGTQRRHLVQSFLFEGATYDLAAAAVGAALGIGVSFAMVRAVANSFSEQSLELHYAVSGRSLLIAYALGVLLTLIVVTGSAWRVSRLNIVSAIRNIPEDGEGGHRRAGWALVVVGSVVGTLLAVSGATGRVFLPWMLGLSIVLMSVVPAVRLAGGNERLGYTAAGLSLVVLWSLPLGTFDRFFGDMTMDFSVWIAGGLIIVIAATWVVTYNADVLLGAVSWLASPFRTLRPVAKMAVAYPLRSRFRTGTTLAMFMLVVFTLVTGSTIPTAFISAFDDVGKFGGGFDVRVTTAPIAATDDLQAALPADIVSQVEAVGAQSFVPVEARQSDAGGEMERYPLRGLDASFLDRTTYEFAAIAQGYHSPRGVWDAMRADPTLAVVDPFVAPRRDQWGFAVKPAFQLSGFYLEEGSFEPVPVEVRDPFTGTSLHLKVIGVLNDNVPLGMAGITVSQAALVPFGERAMPTIHHLAAASGVDPEGLAGSVEAALLTRGAEAQSYRAVLDDAVGSSMLFIRLIQGFMALGLFVGVAALGVITARAVVERRQQIGVLRAIGFQPEMVRRTLLAETSMIAVTAIGVGSVLALIMSYNVIADSKQQLGYSGIRFAVPWLDLALIFAAVLVAALAATSVSAYRAARIYPAEALRYQ